ncbi:MAG TPA: type II secretion system F family protein [Polyangiales bacterium]
MISQWWWLTLASVAVSAGVTGAITCVWLSPAALPRLAAYAARVERDLRFLRVSGAGERVAALQATLCMLLLSTSFVTCTVWGSVAALAVAALPSIWLERGRNARVARIEEQVDAWLLALANALRATPSLGEALASTALLVPVPLSQELELVLREYQLGVALDDALAHTAVRVGSRTLSAALLTLRVARTSGGDLSACLEASAAALREMARLEGVVRAKTAEGKAQAFVISALPAPLFALIDWIDGDFLAPLAGCTKGHAILAIAAALWAAAIMAARRIMRVEV